MILHLFIFELQMMWSVFTDIAKSPQMFSHKQWLHNVGSPSTPLAQH